MPHRSPLIALECVALALGVGPAFGQDCQNQVKIDACKIGCTATSAACSGLCDFASGTCWVGCQAAFGTCDLGCDACNAGCDACCFTHTCNCNDCRDSCDACQRSCDNARDDCESGCRLDCDNCILDCNDDCESICRPFKTVGESCIPLVDRCRSGLVCWPLPFPGKPLPQCFPDEANDPATDDACRSLYSAALAQGAVDTQTAMTYGAGSTFSAGISIVNEQGVVYGPEGDFGCYVMSCVGGASNLAVAAYAAVGFFRSYGDVRGQSIAFVGGVGEVVGFANAQIINTMGEYIGSTDALSFEASYLPIDAGVYDCATVVQTVGMRDPDDGALVPVYNSAPTALCADQEVCADALMCTANPEIDLGSIDPDGDVLTLEHDPPGPYSLGETLVTVTARDPDGASDTCSAFVRVNDCTPPRILSVKATPDVLWPPDNLGHRIHVDVEAVDVCDGRPLCRVVDVDSSGPGGSWSGREGEHPDVDIIDATTVEVRADRTSQRVREYTVFVECTDAAGLTARSSAKVLVGPHAEREPSR